MKRCLLSLVLVLPFSAYFAQSVAILDLNNNVITNQTVDLWYDVNTSAAQQDFIIKNVASGSKRIIAERHQVVLQSPAYELFCWVQCYGPSTNVSPTAMPMASNTTHIFTSHYYPSNTLGTSTIIYTFYDSLNANDSSRFTVNWHITPAGVNNLAAASGTISAIFPNPAATSATVSYQLSNAAQALVKVYNILGNEIKNFNVNAKDGAVTFSVADLEPGIYFCSFVADDKVMATRKLIVSR